MAFGQTGLGMFTAWPASLGAKYHVSTRPFLTPSGLEAVADLIRVGSTTEYGPKLRKPWECASSQDERGFSARVQAAVQAIAAFVSRIVFLRIARPLGATTEDF